VGASLSGLSIPRASATRDCRGGSCWRTARRQRSIGARRFVRQLESGCARAVVLNAGAALYLGGRARTFEQGVELAEQALTARAGLTALERLRQAYAAGAAA